MEKELYITAKCIRGIVYTFVSGKTYNLVIYSYTVEKGYENSMVAESIDTGRACRFDTLEDFLDCFKF